MFYFSPRNLKRILLTTNYWFFILIIIYLNREVPIEVEEEVVSVMPEIIHHSQYGEMGEGVILPDNLTDEVKALIDKGWKDNAFNQYVSDLISVQRTIPDFRDPWCKEPGRFLEDLPVTDVIICFHNEAWSTLLRTVHSVLNRSPPQLIGEIILVDDFSNLREYRFL